MIQNNSFIPDFNTLTSRLGSMKTASFYAVGYAEELVEGQEPKATCYRVPAFMGTDIDNCDRPGTGWEVTICESFYSIWNLWAALFKIVVFGNIAAVSRWLHC